MIVTFLATDRSLMLLFSFKYCMCIGIRMGGCIPVCLFARISTSLCLSTQHLFYCFHAKVFHSTFTTYEILLFLIRFYIYAIRFVSPTCSLPSHYHLMLEIFFDTMHHILLHSILIHFCTDSGT